MGEISRLFPRYFGLGSLSRFPVILFSQYPQFSKNMMTIGIQGAVLGVMVVFSFCSYHVLCMYGYI
jgi:hypothetical protein